MNVRLGFARIARVTAFAYWGCIAIWLAGVWRQGMNTWVAGNSLDPYGHAEFRWSNFGSAGLETLGALLGAAVSYVVLLLIFRGVRWVALGFMDKPVPAEQWYRPDSVD